MATTTNMGRPGTGSLAKAALTIVGALALYFVYEQVIRYFVWNENAYGYYWPFRVSVIIHIVGGFLALLAGVFQLWSGFNGKAMTVHPLTGRVYVVGVLLGALGGIALSVTSAVYGVAWGVSLFALAAAWLAITGMALLCIRKRKVKAHKQWMVRSYILTFGFVTFRIFVDHLPYEALWGITRPEMANAVIWPVWVVPLLAYEIYLQYREL